MSQIFADKIKSAFISVICGKQFKLRLPIPRFKFTHSDFFNFVSLCP
jgi:hypothetical protein